MSAGLRCRRSARAAKRGDVCRLVGRIVKVLASPDRQGSQPGRAQVNSAARRVGFQHGVDPLVGWPIARQVQPADDVVVPG